MLKRYFFIALISTLSFSASASHLLGGHISWEYAESGVNAGLYQFTLTIYADCSGISMGGGQGVIDYPGGAIICNYDAASSGSISPSCINCINNYGVDKHVWKSSWVAIPGLPPASGSNFSWNSSSTPQGLNIPQQPLYVFSTMYKKGVSTPKFLDEAYFLKYGQPQFLSVACDKRNLDSIEYAMDDVYQSAVTGAAWITGYNLNNPFPNTTTNAANGAITIDAETGVIRSNAQVGSSGLYMFGAQVKGYKNGQLAVSSNFVSAASFSTDSTNIFPEISTTLSNASSASYLKESVEVYIGDTLEFDINALDLSMPAEPLSFKGYTEGIGSSNANPVFTQTSAGNTGALGYNVKWYIDPAKYQDGLKYHLMIEFEDSHCVPAKARLDVIVHPKLGNNIFEDSIHVCQGDTLAAALVTSDNWYWAPGALVDDSTAQHPVFTGGSSQYLYLVNTNDSNDVDSVWVNVTPTTPFALQINGLNLSVPMAGFSDITWYFNGIPFAQGLAFIDGFVDGYYYAVVQFGNCEIYSDTVTFSNGTFLSVVPVNNGATTNEAIPFNQEYGFSFNAGGGGFTLNNITLYGLTDSTEAEDTITLRLFDSAGDVIASSKAVRTGYQATFNLDTTLVLMGAGYSLSFSSTDDLYLNMYENLTYPYSVGGMEVTASVYGENGNAPSQSTPYQVAAYASMSSVVGLNEQVGASLKLYPNPVKDYLVIDGLDENQPIDIHVSDISGRRIEVNFAKEGERILVDIKSLNPGVYLVTLNDQMYKVIKE